MSIRIISPMPIDGRPSETLRVWIMALLLGLLIGANNLIKILRDSVFLGHHSVSELPYLYIMVAVLAGVIVGTYTRYTANVSITRLILSTNAIILSNLVFFWIVLTYYNADWSHYALYIWSAMATVIAVAQAWTLANSIFTPEEGKRSFGFIAAGGTVGGVAAGFGANWSIHLSIESNHLLWIVAGIYITASVLVIWAERRLDGRVYEAEIHSPNKPQNTYTNGVGELLSSSSYLKAIAVIILVSVIVSTLIDFQFKTGAKQAYSSTKELAVFFSSYYGWLSVATFFVQVLLTSQTLKKLGLTASLYVTPAALLTGSIVIITWPGLPAATFTRMADTILRNSVHRSGMEVIYMALPVPVVKAIKTFLDVVVERLGDASAGFIILLFSFFSTEKYIAYVHFICLGLIFTWFGFNRFLQKECPQAVRKKMPFEESSPRIGCLGCD
jgi:ATP:ADP antiporter, AAA family